MNLMMKGFRDIAKQRNYLKSIKRMWKNTLKVLKNNCKTTDTPVQVTCESCGSVLEVTEQDVTFGKGGFPYGTCPCCGESIDLDEAFPNAKLTLEELRFPQHFHHVSVDTGAADCFDRELMPHIKEAIQYLRCHPREDSWGGWITGNLFLIIERCEDEYTIYASKDFYETSLPFGQEEHS